MLITVPASAQGGPEVCSVLDLEPLIQFARQCRPDGFRMLPPAGPDDLPNGAALCAIRHQLEGEGIAVAAGRWEIPPDAALTDPSTRLETLFEGRALLAALGEAGLEPLTLAWSLPATDPACREAGLEILNGLLEEAVRGGIGLSLLARNTQAEWAEEVERIDSPLLRLGWAAGAGESAKAAGRCARQLGERLTCVWLEGTDASGESCAERWSAPIRGLSEAGYTGAVAVEGLTSPIEYAHAVGCLRGLLASC